MSAPAHRHWLARRVAQGIGARPLAFRLAGQLGLQGWVRNTGDGLELALWGGGEALTAFAQRWAHQFPLPPAPPLEALVALTEDPTGLAIAASFGGAAHTYPLAPDLGICGACGEELHDPHSRRCADPLMACSQCGPRLSVVRALPYDRANTAWEGFPPCVDCSREYENPGERRFHSQSVSCPVCGPRWWLARGEGVPVRQEAFPLEDVAAHLADGGVLAAQGTGGFHYLCLAENEKAAGVVRALKHRPAQPLAVLVADVDAARELAALTKEEAALLGGPRRPIVLAGRLTGRGRAVSAAVAHRHAERLGLMLPVTGLHVLLCETVGAPLVCSSANVHAAPMPTGVEDLPATAVPWVWTAHHDLPLLRAVDDSVTQWVAGDVQVLRRSRGFAPQPVPLPAPLSVPTVALGGDLHSTVAVGLGREVFLSMHLGDQQSPVARDRAREWLRHVLDHLGVTPMRVLVDAHPGYHVKALAGDFPEADVVPVFHHRAHAAHVLAENEMDDGPVLVATFDGTGYGEDHTPWGGELFLGDPTQPHRLRRVGTVAPLPLPGGGAAVREPRRIVDALGQPNDYSGARSMGRLFDAAAVILGLGEENTFEGDLPARLMNAALAWTRKEVSPLPVHCHEREGLWELDTVGILQTLKKRMENNEPVNALAHALHHAVAAFVVRAAARFEAKALALGGGCFANVLLCEQIVAASPVPVALPRLLPPGDGGLSYGQLAYAAAVDGGIA